MVELMVDDEVRPILLMLFCLESEGTRTLEL